MEAFKTHLAIPVRVALRQCKYLNNVIEQDQRTVKERVWLAKGYGSFQSAWRTFQEIEKSEHDPQGASEMANQS
jgi:transposase-like protein